MTPPTIAAVPEEMNAKAYQRAHNGKLMVVRRDEARELNAADFFLFDSVGTHPTGLFVTGIFQDDRRSHMLASRVRDANDVEIAWRKNSLPTAAV